MKALNLFILFFVGLISYGQETNLESIWVLKKFDKNSTWHFVKKSKLKKNHHNLVLNPDSTMIFRRNSHPNCGTKPISYIDNKGTWEQKENQLLLHYYRNTYAINLVFEINYISEKSLVLKMMGADETIQINRQRSKKHTKI